jgi:hypothetical protein
MSNARNIASIAGEDVLNASNQIVPVYACRAWVNFRGASQSGTLNTSGPVTGLYTATVTGATTFTIEYSSTTYTVTTSGNHEVGDGEGVDLTISGTSVTIDTQIRDSGNVSSITDNGTGNYTANFATAMPDANYTTVISFGNDSGGSGSGWWISRIVSTGTTGVQIYSGRQDNYDRVDATNANVTIFH